MAGGAKKKHRPNRSEVSGKVPAGNALMRAKLNRSFFSLAEL
jgi:hypothetical protein